MVCSKHEESRSAPMSCHEAKTVAPCGKGQHHHHHHHHHHHLQFNGMKLDAVPQEKHGHCHRGKSWWGHRTSQPKDIHSVCPLHETPAKPKCFFRGLQHKNSDQKSAFVFDYSENYN